MSDPLQLPPGVSVFERGWLSANGVMFKGRGSAALVDSGYATHSNQTVALVRRALGPLPLELLINTHLHSDHCGGNAALQRAYPALRTLVPPGQADQARRWDVKQLGYVATGQVCPQFAVDGVLRPGSEIVLADRSWQVHAATGHDPHSVMLFEPASRTLVSADALWENGFGIVFPELEGEAAFHDVALTLDLIATFDPAVVIPGHGRVFGGGAAVHQALGRARRRLSAFMADPVRHARHAAKVLIKFKLLEWQRVSVGELQSWARATSYFGMIIDRYFPDVSVDALTLELVDELVDGGAAARDGESVVNT